MKLIIVAAAAALALLVAASPASAGTIQTTLNGYPTEAAFVDPDATAQDTGPVLDHVVDLIDSVPDGGWIGLGLYAFGYRPILDAITARKDKVNVYALMSGDQFGETTPMDLYNALGSSNFKWCGNPIPGTNTQNDACLSNVATGIQHAKFMTFSAAKDTKGVLRNNVVWFGTANMTLPTGAETINDAITVYGDAGLYNWFSGVFRNMFYGEAIGNDYYQPPRGLYDGAKIEARMSPSVDGDFVIDELGQVATGSGCFGGVMQYRFRRATVATKLANMSAGCAIYVLVDKVSCPVLSALRATGSHVAVRQRGSMHSKTMVFQDHNAALRVYTGSHNLERDALRDNDELFVSIDANQAIYDGYTAMFQRAWGKASTTVTCDPSL